MTLCFVDVFGSLVLSNSGFVCELSCLAARFYGSAANWAPYAFAELDLISKKFGTVDEFRALVHSL